MFIMIREAPWLLKQVQRWMDNILRHLEDAGQLAEELGCYACVQLNPKS